MSKYSKVEIEGYDKLITMLREFGRSNGKAGTKTINKLINGVINPELRRGQKILLSDIKARVPKASGNLAKSYVIKRLKKRPSNAQHFDVGFTITASKKRLLVKRPKMKGYYPNAIESGYVQKTKDGVKHYPAKPHVRPAYDSKAKNLEKEMGTNIMTGLEKIMKDMLD